MFLNITVKQQANASCAKNHGNFVLLEIRLARTKCFLYNEAITHCHHPPGPNLPNKCRYVAG